MAKSVLFSMNANDQRQRLGELRSDQQTALFQALEILAIPRQLSRSAVASALSDPVDFREEARYIDNVRWTQAVSPIACQIGGAMERRDAVRRRLCLALRAARLAASQ
jgi:hypothetical protein